MNCSGMAWNIQLNDKGSIHFHVYPFSILLRSHPFPILSRFSAQENLCFPNQRQTNPRLQYRCIKRYSTQCAYTVTSIVSCGGKLLRILWKTQIFLSTLNKGCSKTLLYTFICITLLPMWLSNTDVMNNWENRALNTLANLNFHLLSVSHGLLAIFIISINLLQEKIELRNNK